MCQSVSRIPKEAPSEWECVQPDSAGGCHLQQPPARVSLSLSRTDLNYNNSWWVFMCQAFYMDGFVQSTQQAWAGIAVIPISQMRKQTAKKGHQAKSLSPDLPRNQQTPGHSELGRAGKLTTYFSLKLNTSLNAFSNIDLRIALIFVETKKNALRLLLETWPFGFKAIGLCLPCSWMNSSGLPGLPLGQKLIIYSWASVGKPPLYSKLLTPHWSLWKLQRTCTSQPIQNQPDANLI